MFKGVSIKLPLLAFLFFLNFATVSFANLYFADPIKSVISFEVKQFKFDQVKGFFQAYTIIVDYDDELNTINRIEAKIDPNSVISGNTIRDRHLRSDKFFDIINYPDILFIVNNSFDRKTREVEGQLSLKDKKQMLTVNYDWVDNVKEDNINFKVVTTAFTIKRHDFNVSGYPFLIEDEVLISLKLYLRPNR
mgnify:CR=1 FL=1|tara:strand:- start:29 stop:604 length:576 start_codon:yes stop_codon:yes gene_type:complete